MNLTVKIREVAESKGVKTAYRLQKIAGINPSTAYRLFNNDVTQISVETLSKLCDALDCDAGELFVRTKSQSRRKR